MKAQSQSPASPCGDLFVYIDISGSFVPNPQNAAGSPYDKALSNLQVALGEASNSGLSECLHVHLYTFAGATNKIDDFPPQKKEKLIARLQALRDRPPSSGSSTNVIRVMENIEFNFNKSERLRTYAIIVSDFAHDTSQGSDPIAQGARSDISDWERFQEEAYKRFRHLLEDPNRRMLILGTAPPQNATDRRRSDAVKSTLTSLSGRGLVVFDVSAGPEEFGNRLLETLSPISLDIRRNNNHDGFLIDISNHLGRDLKGDIVFRCELKQNSSQTTPFVPAGATGRFQVAASSTGQLKISDGDLRVTQYANSYPPKRCFVDAIGGEAPQGGDLRLSSGSDMAYFGPFVELHVDRARPILPILMWQEKNMRVVFRMRGQIGRAGVRLTLYATRGETRYRVGAVELTRSSDMGFFNNLHPRKWTFWQTDIPFDSAKALYLPFCVHDPPELILRAEIVEPDVKDKLPKEDERAAEQIWRQRKDEDILSGHRVGERAHNILEHGLLPLLTLMVAIVILLMRAPHFSLDELEGILGVAVVTFATLYALCHDGEGLATRWENYIAANSPFYTSLLVLGVALFLERCLTRGVFQPGWSPEIVQVQLRSPLFRLRFLSRRLARIRPWLIYGAAACMVLWIYSSGHWADQCVFADGFVPPDIEEELRKITGTPN